MGFFQAPTHDIAQLNDFVVNYFSLTQTSSEKLFKLLNVFTDEPARPNQVMNHRIASRTDTEVPNFTIEGQWCWILHKGN